MAGDPKARDQVSDRALMEQIRDGRRHALRLLLERYWSPLVAYAADIVGRRDDAKDVVQDVFIRVWKKRADWNSTGSASAYLYRIARNLSLNHCRDRDARCDRDEKGGAHLARSGSAPNPHIEWEAKALRADIESAIDALPERRREVFVLSRFHGLTHREIGKAMDISPQTVSNQMTSALAELRERLSHHLRGG